MVEYESLLERDAIYLFEFSPGVISYQEQPALIHYEQGGNLRKYFPDFEVTLRTGEIIHIEIKPSQKLMSKELDQKLTAISQFYWEQGRLFRLLTDADIRQEPRLSNLKVLQEVHRSELDLTMSSEYLKHIFTFHEKVLLADLYSQIGRARVLKHIAKGELRCDFFQSFNSSTNFAWLSLESDYDAVQF